MERVPSRNKRGLGTSSALFTSLRSLGTGADTFYLQACEDEEGTCAADTNVSRVDRVDHGGEP